MPKHTITLVIAPTDYNHPKADPVWKIGDRVFDLLYDYGFGTISKIEPEYEDRAGEKHKRNSYQVELESGGTCMRFGYHLSAFDPKGANNDN